MRQLKGGELPFRAEITTSDGESSSMKVFDAKVINDGVETVVFEDEITLSTNAVDLEGNPIPKSSARLTVPLQSHLEPEILLEGNATVSNRTSKHSIGIEMPGEQGQRWTRKSAGGMFAVIGLGRHRDTGTEYFDILFGVKGQPETVDSDGRKSRPHIAFLPDGNGRFIRLADHRCTLHSQLNYDVVARSISPATISIDSQDLAERLVLKFKFHPNDAKVILTEAFFE